MMFKSIPSNLSILFHLICLCTTRRNSDYSLSVHINKIILFLLEKSAENNSPSILHFWGYFLIYCYVINYITFNYIFKPIQCHGLTKT